MDVRAPEKQTHLWSREKCRRWALEGPFSPKETKMIKEKSLTYPKSKKPSKKEQTAFILSPLHNLEPKAKGP